MLNLNSILKARKRDIINTLAVEFVFAIVRHFICHILYAIMFERLYVYGDVSIARTHERSGVGGKMCLPFFLRSRL